MKTVDAVIVGGATTGSYFARKLSEQGLSVAVLDARPQGSVGDNYDIFHVMRPDFDRFGLPMPEKGDDLAFEFSGSVAYSAYGRHPKAQFGETVGMHRPNYVSRLNRWAAESGAEYVYGASFLSLVMENGRVAGIRYRKDGEEDEIRASLVADCSGLEAVARTSLPDGYGVENFRIADFERFYVILRYVRYRREEDYVHGGTSYPWYKCFENPEADPTCAIHGASAAFSFEEAEKVFQIFTEHIKLPESELVKIDRGVEPYRRPPYSVVADSFIVLGDAACHTKPHMGEGVTSSLVLCNIAAPVIGRLFREGKPLTRENLWEINKSYMDAQGAGYAGMLATMVGAVATSAKENDFFFEKDIIFSEEGFAGMNEDRPLNLSKRELASLAWKMAGGVVRGKLRVKTIRSLMKAMNDGDAMRAHYANFPDSPGGYAQWAAEADALWASCGRMSDSNNLEF